MEPIERRERDDAGIEPAVTNLLHPLAIRPARWAADHDVVDPRPVQLAELVEAALRELPQLLFATDDEEVAVRARIERKRQAPVALAADVPIAHVVEPVLHAAAGGGRQPAHLRRGRDHPGAQLFHRDEPLVIHAEDDLLVAAPAVGVAVCVVGAAEEPTAAFQIVGDLARDIAGVLALEPAIA